MCRLADDPADAFCLSIDTTFSTDEDESGPSARDMLGDVTVPFFPEFEAWPKTSSSDVKASIHGC